MVTVNFNGINMPWKEAVGRAVVLKNQGLGYGIKGYPPALAIFDKQVEEALAKEWEAEECTGCGYPQHHCKCC